MNAFGAVRRLAIQALGLPSFPAIILENTLSPMLKAAVHEAVAFGVPHRFGARRDAAVIGLPTHAPSITGIPLADDRPARSPR